MSDAMTENVKHVDALRDIRLAYGDAPNHFTLEKAALDAAIERLQREAAGDGEGLRKRLLAAAEAANQRANEHAGLNREWYLGRKDAFEDAANMSAPRPTGADDQRTHDEEILRNLERLLRDNPWGLTGRWDEIVEKLIAMVPATPASAEPGEGSAPSAWAWEEKDYDGQWSWRVSYERRRLQSREKWVRNEQQLHPEARGGGEAVDPLSANYEAGFKAGVAFEAKHRLFEEINAPTQPVHPTPAALDAEIERALQRAAKELPEGWIVRVEVERGSAWVDLSDPDGNEDTHGLIDADDTIAAAINRATDAARATTGASE